MLMGRVLLAAGLLIRRSLFSLVYSSDSGNLVVSLDGFLGGLDGFLDLSVNLRRAQSASALEGLAVA
jgi:hypothetical protein